jgi:hypothetical protein
MGNYLGMNGQRRMDSSKDRQRLAALKALVVSAMVALSVPGIAQENSPGSFSLPAGPQPSNDPPSDVQGPVDSESTAPRRTDQPAEPQTRPPVATIAPTPVPRQQRTQPQTPRTQPQAQRPSATTPRPATQQPQAQPRPQATAPAPAPTPSPDTPVSSGDPAAQPLPPAAGAPATDSLPGSDLPGSDLPGLAGPDPAMDPESDPAAVEDDGSIWWWAAAGLIALASLVFMGLRNRKPKPAIAADTPVHLQPVETVPTPPLRTQRPAPAPSPPPAPAPRAATPQPQFDPAQMAGSWRTAAAPPPPPPPPPPPVPRPAPAPVSAQSAEDLDDILPDSALADSAAGASASLGAAKGTPQRHDFGGEAAAPAVPRLLLDYTTLGVDVTLVNAVARYHLGITNMSDIPVSNLALHGAIVQARRGMPPTVDPMRGDSLLPHLQKIADIDPGRTQRCEGQIRLPLGQIEPIEMQGRLLFVPLVHIWIGYDGPDGTRYAVTQSFVLGEESTPPGPRVGPLRLDLGPRRFTAIGQRPLQPA